MKAFPSSEAIYANNVVGIKENSGMDLRDYFAAQAMQVILEVMFNTQPDTSVDDFQFVSIDAYLIADEMMKVRGQ
jgi:glycerol kinase